MAIFAFLSVLTFQTIDGSIRNIEVLDGRMQRLKIYAGGTHSHEAQKPVKIGVK